MLEPPWKWNNLNRSNKLLRHHENTCVHIRSVHTCEREDSAHMSVHAVSHTHVYTTAKVQLYTTMACYIHY